MIDTYLIIAAFFLTFFGFIKRIISFRLNGGILTMWGLWWLLVIMGLLAVCKVIVNFLPTERESYASGFLYLYNLPMATSYREWLTKTYLFLDQLPYKNIGNIIYFFWSTLLVTIIIYLFYKLIYPIKFSKRNARAYLNECSLIIASGIQEDIKQLTSEVCISIPTIFDYASQNKKSTTKDYALSLIGLFSDEIFCKNIVKHNPITLYKIFEIVIANCNQHERPDMNFVNRLILFLFLEGDSQLHREEPYYGLGRFGTFKKLLFGNVNFLKSQYRPLSRWQMFNTSDFDAKAIKKYFEIIEFSLESYLKEDDSLPDVFFAAFYNISDIIRKNIFDLKQYPREDISSLLPHKNLITCSIGMLSVVHFVNDKANLFPDPAKIQEGKYSYHDNDKNIFGALTYGIYKAIEAFAMHHSEYEAIRLLLLEIYPEHHGSKPLKAIQERLDILLKEKMEENLGNLRYPAVTAALIYSFGLCEPRDAKISIQQVLMTELKKKFIRAHASIPEVALDMLPSDTVFESDTKKLIRKHPLRWIRRKEIEELALEE